MAALGWRFDLERREALRSSSQPLVFCGAFSAPEEIDHRAWLRIEDQGAMGSCSGHAVTTVQEVLNFIATGGEAIQLSRMFGYLAGQQQDGLIGRDQGATIHGSVQGARELGCCLEATFPYPRSYTAIIPPAATEEARAHRVRTHAVLRSYDDCFRWLASGVGAIEIGILWTSSLTANETGVIQEVRGAVQGGHALAVVGYSRRTDSRGRRFLWMVNSHGRAWGRDGWAEVAPQLFDVWGRDDQAELIGLTDLEAFTPRTLPTWQGLIG